MEAHSGINGKGPSPLDKRIAEIDAQLKALEEQEAEKLFTEPERPNRFKILTSADLRALPPMQWLVHGLIPKAELVCIYGPRSSGKSFFAYDICASLERGKRYGDDGRNVTKSRTLYVYCEGARGAPGRDLAYLTEHGDGPTPSVLLDCPNLIAEQDFSDLVKVIEQSGGFDVIVLDTLTRMYGASGADENSAKDAARLFNRAQQLNRLTGALIIFIAHTGKDGTRGIRGSSVIEGNADALIEINDRNGVRTAYVEKMKDGPGGATIGFKLKQVALGFDDLGEEITSCVVEHIPTVRAIKSSSPKGDYVDAIRDTMRQIAGDGRAVPVQLVIDHAKQYIVAPEAGKKDCRAGNLRHRGVMTLVNAGELDLCDDGHAIRKHGASRMDAGEWLDA